MDQSAGTWPGRVGFTHELPDSLRSFQESFSGGPAELRLFFVFLAVVIFTITTLVILNRHKAGKMASFAQQSRPDSLFENLLNRIELAQTDKQLLREMTEGAQLRYPVMALLSPGMLDWAGRLWLKEKGPKTVTPEKLTRISAIAVALYDHSSWIII